MKFKNKTNSFLLKFIIQKTFQMKHRDVILIIDGFSSVYASHRKSFRLLFPQTSISLQWKVWNKEKFKP